MINLMILFAKAGSPNVKNGVRRLVGTGANRLQNTLRRGE